MPKVYLDNASTTRVRPEVAKYMQKIMEEDFGNPSSMHMYGVAAERYVSRASEEIAGLLKAKPGEIIFNSGGTEGANTAVIGTALRKKTRGRHIVASPIEHPAVMESLGFLENEGFEVSFLKVDGSGRADIESVRELVRHDTVLVTVMAVNNEIGTIEDLAAVSEAAKEKNPDVIIHTDAVQAFMKKEIFPAGLGIDILTASAHKFHGPKGVGFMYVREKTAIQPTVFGGGQQRGMRSGTENVPGIAGMGMAARLYRDEHDAIHTRIKALSERLFKRLCAMDGVSVIGASEGNRDIFSPYILSAAFRGVKAEVLLHALEEKGVYVSSGSACSSHKRKPSRVLKAIGLDESLIGSTLRFSFGIYNEPSDSDYAADCLKELLPTLRRYRPR